MLIRTIQNLFAFCLTGVIILGCGQNKGSNPVGVTGGSENGYGIGVLNSQFAPVGGREFDQKLFGDWQYQAGNIFRAYTFQSEGDLIIVSYVGANFQGDYSGNYYTNGNQLVLHYANKTYYYTYSVEGDKLTLTDENGQVMVFLRG